MDSNELERERGITILREEHGGPLQGHHRSTSSTRPATPTSAARSSARCRWSTASCCWSMPRKARCRKRGMSCARPSSAACRRLSSSTRSTGPMRGRRKCSTRSTTCSSISTRPKSRSSSPCSTPVAGRARPSDLAAPGDQPAAAVRRDRRARAAAARRPRRAAADAGGQSRLQRLSRPHRDRPHLQRARSAERSRSSCCKLDGRSRKPGHQAVRVRRLQAGGDCRGRRGRHRLPGRHRGHHHRRDHRRSRASRRDSAHRHRRADGVDDLWRQHVAAGRPGRPVRDVASPARAAAAKSCLATCRCRIEDTDTPEQIKVLGRGELQLSILIEMMRREGFELQVSRPEIVDEGDRRQAHGAGRGSGHRRRRRVPGRRHRANWACGAGP